MHFYEIAETWLYEVLNGNMEKEHIYINQPGSVLFARRRIRFLCEVDSKFGRLCRFKKTGWRHTRICQTDHCQSCQEPGNCH